MNFHNRIHFISGKEKTLKTSDGSIRFNQMERKFNFYFRFPFNEKTIVYVYENISNDRAIILRKISSMKLTAYQIEHR